ncbi:MAG: immunoglobulin domain-containing protein [Aristaeellaceae bacterium]
MKKHVLVALLLTMLMCLAVCTTVYAMDLPTINENPYGQIIMEGGTAHYSVTASGEDLHYQWYIRRNTGDESICQNIYDPPLAIPASMTNDSQSPELYMTNTPKEYHRAFIYCVVSNAAGEVESYSCGLTVFSVDVTITGQPENTTVKAGEDAVFTVTYDLATGQDARNCYILDLNGNEQVHFQWQVCRNGVWSDCDAEDSATLVVKDVTLADSGRAYRCVMSMGGNVKCTTDAATLTVVSDVTPPQTGDASRPLLWVALLGVGLLGMVAVMRRKHA